MTRNDHGYCFQHAEMVRYPSTNTAAVVQERAVMHTPGPWRVIDKAVDADGVPRVVAPEGGVCVLCVNRFMGECGPSRQEQANAAFIVRACNSHDALVEALKLAGQYLVDRGVEHQAAVGRTQVLPAILAALKLAEQS